MSNKGNHIFKAGIITCLLVPFMFQACKTSKRAGQSLQTGESFNIEQVESVSKGFKNLTAKAEVSFGGVNFSMNGTLRLVPDSALMISVQPIFGIEVFRLLCTVDSIYVLDKFNKNYFAASYKDVYSKGSISLDMIQGLLCNMPWGLEDGNYAVTRYNDDNFVMISDGYVESSFLIDDEGSILRTTVENKTKNMLLMVEYSDFMPVSGRTDYPLSMNLKYTGQTDMSFSVKTSRVEFDKKVNIGITIPSSYTRVDMDYLMKHLPF